MKRFEFKLFLKRDKLGTIFVEEFDEYTVIASNGWNENKDNENTWFKYALIDKNTGYLVCSSDKKATLLEEYAKLKEKYENVRNENYYKELCRKYKEIKGE